MAGKWHFRYNAVTGVWVTDFSNVTSIEETLQSGMLASFIFFRSARVITKSSFKHILIYVIVWHKRVTLSNFILFYVMLRDVMSCYRLCYSMLCFFLLHVISCYMLSYLIWFYVKCYVMSFYVTLCDIMPCCCIYYMVYVICYSMSCHVMQCHVIYFVVISYAMSFYLNMFWFFCHVRVCQVMACCVVLCMSCCAASRHVTSCNRIT